MNQETAHIVDQAFCKFLADSLDRLQKGVAIIQGNGTILQCNGFAKRLFEQTPQIKVSTGRLEFTDPSHQREFQNAQSLATATIDLDVQQELVLRRDEAFLRPIHIDIRLVDTEFDDLFFLFVTDLEIQQQINIQKATALFRLTDKEAIVLEQLSGTQTEPQIAADLDITKNTLRTHRKNIYAKLNVSSRVELAMLLSILV
ncbi:HTH-type transcriptional regulator MalT [Pseudovibrio sp. Ad13]|uniref:helix-turn-helix transcriptional regulator n=1 Tax=unclassified Pseudovibrio TaxID=2627060 RepID=UPI0007AECE9A|nr:MULTISPECIES: helix-turn-helix transcriptional regulator [unclassified Pseudovibrio]KZK80476.1 HTH-type transcriptional regulator MalT [Pseudovibrio sp. Ad13]KZK97556.1 HTH-type transcriptional regulator MalT [Pseudovibrio sp. W74]KZL04740.1 HTH-type transcriptional regulator MalT [Pseudovibrio sp. Ad14]